MKRKTLVVASALALAVGAVWYTLVSDKGDPEMLGQALVQVVVPDLAGTAAEGETLFNQNCARCHGTNAAGKEGFAPPLVHKIYRPGHHADITFELAAQMGVRSHHWPFGSMPPVEGVTKSDVKKITAYVRALQRENGIN